jgi:hypothetical protein
MAVYQVALPWCSVCCSQHGIHPCPGIVETTGPERLGRRFAARRPAGTETYQVLVAPAGEWFQARIVTVPDVGWSVPGRRGGAKFLATDAEEAARRAVLHIFAHCKEKKIDIAEIDPFQDLCRDDLPTGRRIGGRRFEHKLPALFGVERPRSPGLILNVSPTGLFLHTERLEPEGQRIQLVIVSGQFRIPLAGVVAWSRRNSARGLPAGMGIELEEAPFAYRQFLLRLAADDELADRESSD